MSAPTTEYPIRDILRRSQGKPDLTEEERAEEEERRREREELEREMELLREQERQREEEAKRELEKQQEQLRIKEKERLREQERIRQEQIKKELAEKKSIEKKLEDSKLDDRLNLKVRDSGNESSTHRALKQDTPRTLKQSPSKDPKHRSRITGEEDREKDSSRPRSSNSKSETESLERSLREKRDSSSKILDSASRAPASNVTGTRHSVRDRNSSESYDRGARERGMAVPSKPETYSSTVMQNSRGAGASKDIERRSRHPDSRDISQRLAREDQSEFEGSRRGKSDRRNKWDESSKSEPAGETSAPAKVELSRKVDTSLFHRLTAKPDDTHDTHPSDQAVISDPKLSRNDLPKRPGSLAPLPTSTKGRSANSASENTGTSFRQSSHGKDLTRTARGSPLEHPRSIGGVSGSNRTSNESLEAGMLPSGSSQDRHHSNNHVNDSNLRREYAGDDRYSTSNRDSDFRDRFSDSRSNQGGSRNTRDRDRRDREPDERYDPGTSFEKVREIPFLRICDDSIWDVLIKSPNFF
jgi:hypothetical protein